VKWPQAWEPVSCQLVVDKGSARAAVTRGPGLRKLKNLLKAVARERLVKTSWERLSGCCCDL
jgi:hypothetical protein